MQVDPIKPKLKPPETTHLKLKCGMLLSTFAFKFNLRRYIKDGWQATREIRDRERRHGGRGLHSSTFRLNLSALYGIGGALGVVLGVSRRCQGVLRSIRGC